MLLYQIKPNLWSSNVKRKAKIQIKDTMTFFGSPGIDTATVNLVIVKKRIEWEEVEGDEGKEGYLVIALPPSPGDSHVISYTVKE